MRKVKVKVTIIGRDLLLQKDIDVQSILSRLLQNPRYKGISPKREVKLKIINLNLEDVSVTITGVRYTRSAKQLKVDLARKFLKFFPQTITRVSVNRQTKNVSEEPMQVFRFRE